MHTYARTYIHTYIHHIHHIHHILHIHKRECTYIHAYACMRELKESLENVCIHTHMHAHAHMHMHMHTQGVVMGKDLLDHYADIVAGYSLGDNALVSLLRATWGMGSRH